MASTFTPNIQSKWPWLYEEMKGVADGAGVEVLDVVALNCRSEIALTKFSDGCTSLACPSTTSGADGSTWLAQNWDWKHEQKENMILLHIHADGKPKISMVTEAGIIGKIGLNSSGVGVCLNAIRATNLDPTLPPIHLALRLVLESTSLNNAVKMLEKERGVAGFGHFLIADHTDAKGCEVGPKGVFAVDSEHGWVTHTNHLVAIPDTLKDEIDDDPEWLTDSPVRLTRIRELIKNAPAEVGQERIRSMLSDEQNQPGAICRAGDLETVFNIIMEFNKDGSMGWVVEGRPSEGQKAVTFGY
ncbi:putative acyl-CoA:6-aminopenicillanic-acid-acyltransferase [Saitoella complicata NRRL Y-17804]|nr:putative acyl-CoA:6-aminopenicillanic-acid-acyltransferase [Saitoella complicata NRRL Y-17804]ODQ53736.1 putative acyl-CoA:6-aminopenicillanic-acid-acyltransferase [Saitoella complicata NRRL Y-17804]